MGDLAERFDEKNTNCFTSWAPKTIVINFKWSYRYTLIFIYIYIYGAPIIGLINEWVTGLFHPT